jgi:hypothetical protein
MFQIVVDEVHKYQVLTNNNNHFKLGLMKKEKETRLKYYLS